MIIQSQKNKQVIISNFTMANLDNLIEYLCLLSPDTKKRFAPHSFEKASVFELYNSTEKIKGYIAREIETNRIILWGGVQVENKKAVGYYLKNGFSILGQFEYNGANYDMVLDI
jgi:hypothetical protein